MCTKPPNEKEPEDNTGADLAEDIEDYLGVDEENEEDDE